MSEDNSKGARVRALARQVLGSSQPNDLPETGDIPVKEDIAVKEVHTGISEENEISRDESGKTVITAEDLRGVPERARVLVREGARLTALAEDIVRERNIQLVNRKARRR